MRTILGVIGALVISLHMTSLGLGDEVPGEFQKKQLLILKSTKTYSEAKTFADSAASKLGMKLDLEGYAENEKAGLSLSAKGCEADGFDYPCYVPRGRFGDAQYLSIEFSSAYKGFDKGFYMVVAAVSFANDPALKDLLNKLRSKYPDSYLKYAEIYMGCLH